MTANRTDRPLARHLTCLLLVAFVALGAHTAAAQNTAYERQIADRFAAQLRGEAIECPLFFPQLTPIAACVHVEDSYDRVGQQIDGLVHVANDARWTLPRWNVGPDLLLRAVEIDGGPMMLVVLSPKLDSRAHATVWILEYARYPQ